MNDVSTPMLWIAFGFVALLLGFFIVAYFLPKDGSQLQHTILRVLCSLCAGFAGIFVPGSNIFNLERNFGNSGKLVISGVGGGALFFVVWFFFGKWQASWNKDAFNFGVPEGWTFYQAICGITKAAKAGHDIDPKFTKDELNARLLAREFQQTTAVEALKVLRSITQEPNSIRQYDVKRIDSNYALVVED